MKKDKNSKKPKVLLHICCGPDSTAVYERLDPQYEVIGYFHNPNIYPEKEYEKRAHNALKAGKELGFEVLVPEYNPKEWLKAVKGLEKEPEGGKRCEKCFRFNLEATAKKALELGISFFTTTLTISPHKSSDTIFKIGRGLAEEYGIVFLDINFNKKDGFKRSVELSKQMGLYRQKYCGCSFSKEKG
ncbi:MAG TPA: epoxyqueuosine reductase QueH [Acidobacteriota bacterium]|nr:epoxyqueuosine reductase QueH [Acidobacteriota bacterium]